MPPRDSLQQFVDEAKAIAAESFNQRGVHMPTFLLEDAEGVVFPIGAQWATPTEKQIVLLSVRQMCLHVNARRAVIITEGWMVQRERNAPTAGIVPSLAPDRIEILWVAGQSAVKGEGEVSGWFPIERAGKPRVGAWTQTEQTMSIFDGLLGGRVFQ